MATRSTTKSRASRTRTSEAETPTPSAPEPAVTETPSADTAEPVVLTGRLVATPQLRHTKTSGKPVTSIRLAVDGEEKRYETVVCWARTAEVVCQFLRPGRSVECRGHWRDRQFTASDGSSRQVRELNAFSVQFLGRQPAPEQTAEDERAVA